MGLGVAIGSFLKALVNPDYARRVKEIATAESQKQTARLPLSPQPDSSLTEEHRRDGAVALLSRLQQEGRLVDFLAEDLSNYADAEIGAAIRPVHEGCRRALDACIERGRIIEQEEGSSYRVNEDYPAHSIKLSGRVGQTFPQKGTLLHPGWRVREVRLPGVNPDARDVLAPAEVEL